MNIIIKVYLVFVSISLLGIAFFFLKKRKKKFNPKDYQPHSLGQVSSFVVDFNSIVEVYKFKDMFFMISATCTNGTIYEFILSIGLFSKLQLNIVKKDGVEIWLGKHILEIGGSSSNLLYLASLNSIEERIHPSLYLFPCGSLNEITDNSFVIKYDIDMKLNKRISVYDQGVDTDWRHVAREIIKVDFLKSIEESAIYTSGFNSIKYSFFKSLNETNLGFHFEQFSFLLIYPSDQITFALPTDSVYKFAFLGFSNFSLPDTGDLDDEKLNTFFKNNLFSNITADHHSRVLYYKNIKGENKVIDLNGHNAQFGVQSPSGFRMHMRATLSSDDFHEVVQYTFYPQFSLEKDLLCIWRI